MDMEFRDDRRRGKFIIAIGLILALVAGGAAFYLVTQAQGQAGQQDLKKAAIVAEDVAIREVPLDATNANGVVTDPNEVIGRIPAVSILQDQPVTQNMLA